MASALTWLATRLEDAQDDLDAARTALALVDFEILAAAAKDLVTPCRSRTAELADERERVLAQGRRALEDAERDSRTAAGRFDDIAAGAAAIDDRVGPTPGAPTRSGLTPTKMSLLAVVLLGSVAHNRMKGSGFERAMLSKLGLTKNTQKIVVPLRGRLKGVIPDGLTKSELAEIKSSRYQPNSSQLQRMQRLATTARPLVLVVGPKTRLSKPLAEAIRNSQGAMQLRRWVGNGVYSDNAKPDRAGTLYRREGGRFVKVPPSHQTIPGRPGPPSVRGIPKPPSTGAPAPRGPSPTAPRPRIPVGPRIPW